jgi:hypothetical protein
MSGSYYSVQNLFPFIGASKSSNGAITLSPVTLTVTASDNRAQIDVDGAQQVMLFIRFTTHASDTNAVLELVVDYSPDGTNFYQEISEESSSTAITEYIVPRQFTGAAAGTAYSFRVPLPIADIKKLRIGFRETAGANFGTLSCLAVVSGQ